MEDVEAAIEALEWGKEEFMKSSRSTAPAKSAAAAELATAASRTMENASDERKGDEISRSPLAHEPRATLAVPSSSRLTSGGATTGLRAGDLASTTASVAAKLQRVQADLATSQRECSALKHQVRELTLASEQHAGSAQRLRALEAEKHSLQQQLWDARREVETWKLRDAEAQAELAAAKTTSEQLRKRISELQQDFHNNLEQTRKELGHARQDRDNAIQELHHARMSSVNAGIDSVAGATAFAGDHGVHDPAGDPRILSTSQITHEALPEQVTLRLRQAAAVNHELRLRLDAAEEQAARAEELENHLREFSKLISDKATMVDESQSLDAKQDGGAPVFMGIAREAGHVVASASDVLHQFAAQHGAVMSHAAELQHQLNEAQRRLGAMDESHKLEIAHMDASHRKILDKLADVTAESSMLAHSLERSAHEDIEHAVSQLTQDLKAERRGRRAAEKTMKQYRMRVDEWKEALERSNRRAQDAEMRLGHMTAKLEQTKDLLKRAKARVNKLQGDRNALRDYVRQHRAREAELAQQAASQAETQMRALTALRKEVEQDSHALRVATTSLSGAYRAPSDHASAPVAFGSDLELRRQSSIRLLQKQIDRAKKGVAEAQETLRLQQLRYGSAVSSPSRQSLSQRLHRHRTSAPLTGIV